MKNEALTKSQVKEVEKLHLYYRVGDMQDTVALGLSALIRASRTPAQRAALLEYADKFSVKNHPEFII